MRRRRWRRAGFWLSTIRFRIPIKMRAHFRMVQILKAVRESGNDVTFVPADMIYRAPHAGDLAQFGIDVVYQPFYESIQDFLARRGTDFNLIILSRADVASQYLEPVRKFAQRAKVVFDTVDLHFLREERAALVLNDSRMAHTARRRKRQELALASQCDATLVVSPAEKLVLEAECPGLEVRLLPTIMEIPGDAPPAFEDRQHVLFIGEFGHLPNVDAVVYFVEEILPLVVARLPELIFVVVGSNAPEKIRALAGKNVRILGYVQDLKPIFDQARVAVAPLRFGAGVKGKVNQSMAYGVPSVVSTIAAEGMHLVHEHNAMIAGDPASFADAVLRLWTAKPLWQMVSANGRENVREHFSVESASRRIDELLAFAGLPGKVPSGRETRPAPPARLVSNERTDTPAASGHEMEPSRSMSPKFIIVNNGMTGLRGHYFETGISIATPPKNGRSTP